MQINDWYEIELLVLDNSTWNHVTVCQQMVTPLFLLFPGSLTQSGIAQSAGALEYTDYPSAER